MTTKIHKLKDLIVNFYLKRDADGDKKIFFECKTIYLVSKVEFLYVLLGYY